VHVEAVRERQRGALLDVRLTSFLYTVAICSSGSRIITTSAAFTASATSATLRPAFSTLGQLAPPLRRPTMTLQPLSFRFCAWAWPCEP